MVAGQNFVSDFGNAVIAKAVALDKFGETIRFGNHPMVAVAPTCEGIDFDGHAMEPKSSNGEPIPLALTGRQKVALMLARAGYSHGEIARRLGIRHRQAASRLIARARAANAARCRTAAAALAEADL